jgi:hypothetical protein
MYGAQEYTRSKSAVFVVTIAVLDQNVERKNVVSLRWVGVELWS